MVVKKEILFGNDYFEGFKPENEIDYQSRILKNFEWRERTIIENDQKYKQPIVYSIIVNPVSKKVFIYQRSPQDKKYSEKRLQGKWSWGIGGHIEKIDKKGDPILASQLRELKEEITIGKPVTSKLLGYINNDTDEVGKVHFGILYVVETHNRIIIPKAPEIESGALRPLKEIDKICSLPGYEVEEWSRISSNPLKLYLQGSLKGKFIIRWPLEK